MLYECCIEKTRYHLGMATTSYCGSFFFELIGKCNNLLALKSFYLIWSIFDDFYWF